MYISVSRAQAQSDDASQNATEIILPRPQRVKVNGRKSLPIYHPAPQVKVHHIPVRAYTSYLHPERTLTSTGYLGFQPAQGEKTAVYSRVLGMPFVVLRISRQGLLRLGYTRSRPSCSELHA